MQFLDLNKMNRKPLSYRSGFTLMEIMVVLMLASMIAVAAVEVYTHIRISSGRIDDKLSESRLAEEILQRIAEDLDRIAVTGADCRLTLRSKIQNGYTVYRLEVETSYYDSQTRPEQHPYEKVIWQTAYDPFTDSLMLYRAHQGIKLEDGITDRTVAGDPREDIEMFIPLCTGITYFSIEIPVGESFVKSWTRTNLPYGLQVSVSLAQPVANDMGEYIIPENKILTRDIAVDHTRKIAFKFVKKDFDMSLFSTGDPNELDDILYDDTENQEDPDPDTPEQVEEGGENPEEIEDLPPDEDVNI
jgi:prepilin-type N-terminal cleavage/methylation domain-containing protein